MKSPMTEVEYTGAKLHERMALTVAGQVTWAAPSLGKRCVQCHHFASSGKGSSLGVCGLVKVMTKKKGTAFSGQSAWACSKFSASQGAPQ